MSSLFNFLEQVNGFLVRMEKGLIILVLFLLIVLSFGQVIARNFFKVGYMWIDELTRCIVLWMAFIGGALCSEYARHMRIDIVLHLVKGAKKRVIESVGNGFVIVICSFLFIASIKHIKYQMDSTVQLMLQGVPDWVISLVIPYFFAVTILRALLRMKKDILGEEQVKLPIMGSADLNES
ncbi:trap-type c4-dicarboxylate transport system, small permease component [hydrocarbon metagenome]|uniref:Trap-type c4-dicarboxylate transport system, small permease component n=1 Tax=hydrocarbon metagenome TaxID=938273 RepID=A0A0W8FQK0_9ZZZZ